MTLLLTIRIEDLDKPQQARQATTECADLWVALYELEQVLGPKFKSELMTLSWDALTRPRKEPPDPSVAVRL